MTALDTLLQQVDQRKARLDAHRPLPSFTAASLRERLALEWTYNSNAIEGNTLTLRETQVVLEHGITIGKKTLREHFEAINHRDAVVFVDELVSRAAQLDEWAIRNIHQLVYKNIDDQWAGKYRGENVAIVGASFVPTDHVHLAASMAELLRWYHAEAQMLHPVVRAAQLHTRFIEIHPFTDGNGRTARLLLNFELMRSGYPVVVIRTEDRLDYYEALDQACMHGQFDGFVQMVAGGLLCSLDLYLTVIEGAPS
ncbi:Fic family protein [Amantichitinum ursilacus]|uniref:Fic/DOC family protein n=1 Tax=Amantichitinum ursilacus TaxID=857265 RepID=A0A0N0GMF7_9NEIS|nr:Fic family protein [Amantichitinum ursilacus]KPC51348.1 Fic/DOC family protein [Amantichitinum ursilacus]